ncbi:MAG TPA: hypothetical protein VFZ48_02545, partial [Candidatus Saccharimonadales bacterium]
RNPKLINTQQHRRATALIATPFALSSSVLAVIFGHREEFWLSLLMYIVSTGVVSMLAWKYVADLVNPATLYSHVGGGNVFSSTENVRAFHAGPVDLYVHNRNTGELTLYRMDALGTDETPAQLVFAKVVVDESITK